MALPGAPYIFRFVSNAYLYGRAYNSALTVSPGGLYVFEQGCDTLFSSRNILSVFQ
jgi:hypothetical protein